MIPPAFDVLDCDPTTPDDCRYTTKYMKDMVKWQPTAQGAATGLTFDMDYEFGGGVAGKLLGRAAEPIVRGNL
jgi:hypothetical protein